MPQRALCFLSDCRSAKGWIRSRRKISLSLKIYTPFHWAKFRSFIHPSMSLQLFIGPWPLFSFRNLFYTVVGLLGREISPPQERYLHTGQHKYRINAHTDIQASSGIRFHDPSVRGSEDSSCL
jgi:hypothetical protein